MSEEFDRTRRTLAHDLIAISGGVDAIVVSFLLSVVSCLEESLRLDHFLLVFHNKIH